MMNIDYLISGSKGAVKDKKDLSEGLRHQHGEDLMPQIQKEQFQHE